jgi:general secretion pathway protein E
MVAPTAAEDVPLLEVEAVARAPVVRAVDMIVAQAVKERASDVHIIPRGDSVKVLYRIDGVLHEAVTLPLGVHAALVSRIKVLSNMNIAERRRPQDGQFSLKINDKDKEEVDFRVATAETHHGEMVAIRVLDKSGAVLQLTDIGLQPNPLQLFQTLLTSPFGMLLVSGPTGSGKTTSLYSALNQLIPLKRNILTIEDPIEYHFEEINQLQVNRQAGVTFAAGLRAIMRLDPDIILVGEIRDAETATTAVQAALTGHLVLSSIHANDAAGSIIRLIDMGVEPFLVVSAVIGAVAQRLVRRVCPYCLTTAAVPPAEAMAYQNEMHEPHTEFQVGRGCNFCSHTGFRGRVGVFEVLAMNDQIRALVPKGATASEIRKEAISDGMIPMRHDGMLKAKDAITTPGEVVRNVFNIMG